MDDPPRPPRPPRPPSPPPPDIPEQHDVEIEDGGVIGVMHLSLDPNGELEVSFNT